MRKTKRKRDYGEREHNVERRGRNKSSEEKEKMLRKRNQDTSVR